MTPDIYQELSLRLRKEALPLHRLHSITKECGSDWSIEQLRLFFRSLKGVDVTNDQDELVRFEASNPRDQLRDKIIKIVESRSGAPVHAEEIRKLLPDRFVSTVEQIKAIAKESPELEVFGPGLVRKKR